LAAAGDAAAYAGLVDRYGGRLHAMLLHLAQGDHELAAEFTQEAFVRAWERLGQFAGASSFYTWIYRLARNRALDLLDRRRPERFAAEVGGEAGDGGAVAATAAPGERMVREEQRAAVQAALATLPAASREILLLRDFEDLDYAAIAEMLEVPVGTVKSRISRARGELRAALAGRIGAEDLS
jgi:RNA polymerase sigma-70 factor (ECF subfamily)